MISPQTEDEIRHLRDVQNSYQPADAIKTQLQSKSIIILVGAAAEGKSNAMYAAATLDARFGVAKAFTTRESRGAEDRGRYTYYEQSDDGLQPLLERLRNRHVVQYAVNPFGFHIYGTELQDYPYRYNLMDAWSTSVDGLRQLGFGSSVAASIITDPVVWLERFNARFPAGHELRPLRAQEAIQSFTWSLTQPDDGQHFWVENTDGPQAAQTIIDIVDGKSRGNAQARELCEQSIVAAQGILA